MQINLTKFTKNKNKLLKRENITTYRANYELPFFLLLAYAIHASIYGIHEALLAINFNNNIQKLFKDFKKVSTIYVKNYVVSSNLISSLRNTLHYLERANNRVAEIIRYYVFSYLTSGETLRALEYITFKSIEELKNDLTAKTTIVTTLIEASAILPLISIFLIAFNSLTIFALIIVLLIVLIGANTIYIPLFSLFILSDTTKNYVAALSLYFLTIFSLYIINFAYFPLIYQFSITIISILLSVYMSLFYYRLYKDFKLKTASLKYVIRIAEIGADNVSSLISILRRDKTIDKEIKKVVISGKEPTRIEENKGTTILSNIIISIIFNSMRSGVNISKTALLLSKFLDSMYTMLKTLLAKSIYYNMIIVAMYAMYYAGLKFMKYSLTMSLGEFKSIIPALGLLELLSNQMLFNLTLFFTSILFSIAMLIVAKMYRGSYFVCPEIVLLPVASFSVNLALELVT